MHIYNAAYVGKRFLAIFEILVGLLEGLLVSHQIGLHLGQFSREVLDILENLVRAQIRIFRLPFAGVGLVHSIVLLKLHRLHLLLDDIHGGGFVSRIVPTEKLSNLLKIRAFMLNPVIVVEFALSRAFRARGEEAEGG